MKYLNILSVAWSLIFLVACDASLEPTSRITKARIIGAQYTVQEDVSRTTPRPGETVDVLLHVTQPAAPTVNSWAFIVCEPAPTTFGVPRCVEGDPIGFFGTDAPLAEAPAFSVRIPEGTQGDLVYIGGVCMGGELGPLDAEDSSGLANPCADEGVGRLVTGTLRVQTEEGEAHENHAPQIEGVALDDEPWVSRPDAAGSQACDAEMPRVSFSDQDVVSIQVFPEPGSREALPSAESGPEVEELPVAFFATERGLVQFYSVIDELRDHAETEFDTRDIPAVDAESIPPEGRVVRFEIVMRDDRGGVARESRALCLLP